MLDFLWSSALPEAANTTVPTAAAAAAATDAMVVEDVNPKGKGKAKDRTKGGTKADTDADDAAAELAQIRMLDRDPEVEIAKHRRRAA